MRNLAWFFLALFFANNAGAALRACIADAAMHEHGAAAISAMVTDHAPCPQYRGTGPCLKHFAQSYPGYPSGEQWLGASLAQQVLAPVIAIVQPSIQARPKIIAAAEAPPSVGPPRTILFGNLRH